MADTGTAIPSEGRLINTALEIDPATADISHVYVIGWLGQVNIGKAPLVAVNLAQFKKSLSGGAVAANNAAPVEDAAVVPAAARTRAVAAEPQALAAEPGAETRVSLEEMFDSNNGLKQADFAYMIETAEDGTVKAALVDDSQHVLVAPDAAPLELTAQLKTQGRKTFVAFDTGIPASEVKLATLSVSVEAQAPVAVSYYVKKDHVWVAGGDSKATYHVHVMTALVPKNTTIQVITA